MTQPLSPETNTALEGNRLAQALSLFKECGYDGNQVHPECYRNFSYVKFFHLLYQSGVNVQCAPEPVVEVRAALANLVAKLNEVHRDPRFKSVWAVNQLHAGQYSGPTYTEELDAAEAALAALAVTSTERDSPVMGAAKRAAKVVDGWSDAKRDYADRVTSTNSEVCPVCMGGDGATK